MKKFFSLIAAVLFAGSMFATQAVLQYPGGTTTNMNETDNYAATFGLDDSYFTVTAIKGSPNNNIGLNKGGDIRLYVYNGVGNTLVVSIAGGAIDSIQLNIKQNTTFEVKAGEGDAAQVVTATNNWFVINSNRFTIQNTTASGTTQLQLNSITIEYTTDGSIFAKPVISPEETSFSGSVDVSIEAEEGAKIYYTLDETDPTVESTEYTAPFTLTATTLVKAIAVKGEMVSPIAEKRYTLLDTISVTEARALINSAPNKTYVGTHFIKGVVAGKPYITGSGGFKGNIIVWLTDIENKNDSLEGYYIAGLNNQPWESLEAAQAEIGEKDTILMYATKMKLYNNSIYETESNSAYYAGMLGKYVEDSTIVYDTLTVAEAIVAAEALADNATSEKKYYIEGYTNHVQAYDVQKSNQIFFMYDEGKEDQDSVFEAYLATPKKEGKAYPVLEGDKVRVFGFLKKYVNTKNNNEKILEVVEPTVAFIEEVEGDRTIEIPTVDTITVAKALEIGNALADKAVSEKEYVIKGYSCDIYAPFDEQFKNETFWISDVKGTRTNDKTKAFEVYRGKPNTEKEIGLDALIQIKCKIKNYNGTIENDGVNITFEVLEQGIIETVDTITVAQALEIGKALEVGTTTSKSYEITGYVSSIINSFDEQYKNETFWITDSMGSRAASTAEGAFEVYRGKPNTGAEIGLNAKVRLVCKIKNYNGTIENDGSNLTVEVLEPGFIPDPDTISVAQAVEIAQALEPGKYSADEYVVVGYAVKVYEKNQDGSWSFYMADDADVEGEFMASSCKADSDVLQNDYMYVRGKITKYKSSAGNIILQIYQGKGVHGVAPEIPEITVAQALEIAQALTPEAGKSITTESKYAVKGYVIEVEDEDEYTYILSDNPEAEATPSDFKAYKCASIDAPVQEGDLIIVIGKIEAMNTPVAGQSYYTYYVNAGVLKHQSAEGIQQVVLTEKAQKMMIDGAIYIIRNGKMFDVRGAQVR